MHSRSAMKTESAPPPPAHLSGLGNRLAKLLDAREGDEAGPVPAGEEAGQRRFAGAGRPSEDQ